MHKLDIGTVEMTLDVIKYAINRITDTRPQLGAPKTEEELKELVGDTIIPEGIGGEKAFRIFRDILVKATVPIDHPRHLAFVPAAPTRAAVMFDLVTSAASIHGAFWMEGAGGIFCENEAIKWLISLTGMPEGAFGVFTSGGSAANLSAMVTAREQWRKRESHDNEKGIVLTSSGAHSSIKAMAKVMDVDVLSVATEDRMTGDLLDHKFNQLGEDQCKRIFAVVATGGTTNAGIVDDLEGIAKFCQDKDLWFHIDAAYGGGALVSDTAKHLFNGIEQADSITIDPHKWLFSPYDCGAILYKEPALAKEAHEQEGSYLEIIKDPGAHGFNPADYQIQLTRRLRGLPLWFSLAKHGTDKYKWAVERGISLAKMAGQLIQEREELELVRPPSLSIVLFRRLGWSEEDYKSWTYRNHKEGIALVTPTFWKNGDSYEMVIRFCFINPDTKEDDISAILDTLK